MAVSHEFDFSVPFDIMVGLWIGSTILYSPTGEYLSSSASKVTIRWERPGTLLHFRQLVEPIPEHPLVGAEFSSNVEKLRKAHQKKSADIRKIAPHPDRLQDKASLNSVAAVTTLEFDLKVAGRFATAQTDDWSVTGVNSRPDLYLFHLLRKDRTQNWFNNQYFTSANERQIIGPVLDQDGQIYLVVTQTFSRVSYDIPTSDRAS
jgi:hypothetical protein